MAKRVSGRHKKRKRSLKRRMRVIRAYVLRLALLAAFAFIIFLSLRLVAHIFRSEPHETASVEASDGGSEPVEVSFGAGEARAGMEKSPGYEAEQQSVSDEAEAEDGGITETLVVDPKGRITQEIEEPFDEDEYSADELKGMIESEISAYNSIAGDAVALDGFKVSRDVARTSLTFESAADYREFNGIDIYIGTVDELTLAGIAYDKELRSASGDEKGAGSTKEISEQGLMTLAIDGSAAIKLPGRILYTGGDVTLTGKKRAEVKKGDGYSFIIYKRPFLNISLF